MNEHNQQLFDDRDAEEMSVSLSRINNALHPPQELFHKVLGAIEETHSKEVKKPIVSPYGSTSTWGALSNWKILSPAFLVVLFFMVSVIRNGEEAVVPMAYNTGAGEAPVPVLMKSMAVREETTIQAPTASEDTSPPAAGARMAVMSLESVPPASTGNIDDIMQLINQDANTEAQVLGDSVVDSALISGEVQNLTEIGNSYDQTQF